MFVHAHLRLPLDTKTYANPNRFNGVMTYAQKDWGKQKGSGTVKQQCTNPASRIVAQTVCCDNDSGKILQSELGQCLFSFETVTFATAQQRCAAEFPGKGAMCKLNLYPGNAAAYSCSAPGAQHECICSTQ